VGVVLVDEASWPIRKEDDLEFLESIRNFAKPDHLAVLTREVESGCRRISSNRSL